MEKNWFCRGILIVYILLIYACYPDFHLGVTTEPYTLYPYLTQGFLQGHLGLALAPSPELLNLANPYDPLQNSQFKLHDASLFQGKYYLYFGPLPVIIFYLPFKLLTGIYPTDALAVFFFVSLAFIVNFCLLIKIKNRYFPGVSEIQVLLMGFLLGLATGAPLLLSVPRVYEAAISSAFCFMSFALFFLYRAIHEGYKTRTIFLFSLCLSLTVAGRPHFALICVFMIPAFLSYIIRFSPTENRLSPIIALVVPTAIIALILALYNYFRFGSIFDLGHSWQLSCNDIKALYGELADISKIPRNIRYSFYYYFIQPFTFSSKFPFIRLQMHDCWYHIDNDYYLESIAGVLTTVPFIVTILALPKLIKRYCQKEAKAALNQFIKLVLLVPTINVLFLLLLPFAIQRYEIDFLPYLVMLAIISFWLIEDYFKPGPRWVLKILFNIMAIFSIFVGWSLGLAYWILK